VQINLSSGTNENTIKKCSIPCTALSLHEATRLSNFVTFQSLCRTARNESVLGGSRCRCGGATAWRASLLSIRLSSDRLSSSELDNREYDKYDIMHGGGLGDCRRSRSYSSG